MNVQHKARISSDPHIDQCWGKKKKDKIWATLVVYLTGYQSVKEILKQWQPQNFMNCTDSTIWTGQDISARGSSLEGLYILDVCSWQAEASWPTEAAASMLVFPTHSWHLTRGGQGKHGLFEPHGLEKLRSTLLHLKQFLVPEGT